MPKSITPTQLKARLDANDDLVIIDVRNDWELEITKLDVAEHIVLHEIPTRTTEIPRNKDVVFLCRSGGRSMQAAFFLEQQGFDGERLFNLEDGILGWARDVDPSLPPNY
jgi:sulfur-carrier protein adenylyltransferase/sulfurtransferase